MCTYMRHAAHGTWQTTLLLPQISLRCTWLAAHPPCTCTWLIHTHMHSAVLRVLRIRQVNRRVAEYAAQRGCLVGVKSSPLDVEGSVELRTLLADGSVRLLMMAGFEAQLLLQLDRAPADVADADAAATALLDEFPSLAIVVISLPGIAAIVRCEAQGLHTAHLHAAHLHAALRATLHTTRLHNSWSGRDRGLPPPRSHSQVDG